MVRAASSSILGTNSGKTSHYSVSQILAEREHEDFLQRKTRLVCTMGPACWDVDTLVTMINEGMTVARFNFSHADHDTHTKTLGRVREAAKITGKHVGILLDTKGPEIRT
ncbi:MAG: hypothetical protein KVP17_005216, partial [Porospora cf. gigantea B]|uniref:uncharacterized protein n=1 Tax=Porospora cf. gigantea B TaxID=2853592 RepID=UPI003571C8AA